MSQHPAKRIGLFLGPILAVIMMLVGAPDGLSFAAWGTGALLVWMAIWWATEAIPIAVTSLLPLVVLPLVGAGSPKDIGAGYAHHVVLLLFGGFVVALGIERWNLHKRIALNVVARVGATPYQIIFGFMLATGLLSMWISNTATTLMMVPIALSAASALNDRTGGFTTALLLGICYAASIGGVGTPIGTPTNLIALDWLQANVEGIEVGFVQWMGVGVPAVLLLIPVAWWSVTRGMPELEKSDAAMESVRLDLKSLGGMTTPEIRVATIFGIVALLWVSRLWTVKLAEHYGWDTLANYSGAQVDMMIAIAGAVAMFVVPSGDRSQDTRALLNWNEAVKLPWGVLVLFGGGITLGNTIKSTGLSAWIGNQMEFLSGFPMLLFVLIVVTLVLFLTELTSNVATMTTLTPILGPLAVGIGIAPASLLAPAAVAASCAFMLPVATAPNAIIYATDKVTMQQMMTAGLRVNLIGILIISVIGVTLAPMLLG
ncbi:MAG: DASS family sodium-coupled anion symporter [Pseudomonadota bacterium]